jgi:hypothetical protein
VVDNQTYVPGDDLDPPSRAPDTVPPSHSKPFTLEELASFSLKRLLRSDRPDPIGSLRRGLLRQFGGAAFGLQRELRRCERWRRRHDLWVLCTLHCLQGESEAMSGMKESAFNISAVHVDVDHSVWVVCGDESLWLSAGSESQTTGHALANHSLNHASRRPSLSPLYDITSPCSLVSSRRSSGLLTP